MSRLAGQIHSGGLHDRGSVAKNASHPQAEDRDSVVCAASHAPFSGGAWTESARPDRVNAY